MNAAKVIAPGDCVHGCERQVVFDARRDRWVHVPWLVTAMEFPYWHQATPWSLDEEGPR